MAQSGSVPVSALHSWKARLWQMFFELEKQVTTCFCYWILLRAWELQIRPGSRSVSSCLVPRSPQVAQETLLYPVASTYEVICSSYPSSLDWLWSVTASFAIILIKYWNHSCGVHQTPVEMILKSIGCQTSDVLCPVSPACHTQETKLIEWGME